ncbi:hypothetical protein JNUCC0626_39380 [Lentzea sp. JNUCC 0626]|uniref:hypothetical protein n=1 Tax=Lentzea sp. JNUCC 0626 TaxID=3367513 RepID=UPI003747E574
MTCASAHRPAVAVADQGDVLVVDASPRLDPCDDLMATLRAEVTRLDDQAAEIARCRGLIADILERSTA